MELRDLPNRVIVKEFPLKLDLGCGEYKQIGFHGFDWGEYGQEIKWNIKNGIPLPDNCVIELFTSHFLEHLNREDMYNTLAEMLRVCQNGAKVTIKVPHGETPEGHLPCHYQLLTEVDMLAIEQNWKPHYEAKNRDYPSAYKLIKEPYRDGYHLIAEFKINK